MRAERTNPIDHIALEKMLKVGALGLMKGLVS